MSSDVPRGDPGRELAPNALLRNTRSTALTRIQYIFLTDAHLSQRTISANLHDLYLDYVCIRESEFTLR